MDLAIYFFKQRIRNVNLPVFKMLLDKNISLMDYFRNDMPSLEAVRSGMKLLGVNSKQITPQLVIDCFREANPPVYNLIMTHPNGTNWVNQTVRELKRMYS